MAKPKPNLLEETLLQETQAATERETAPETVAVAPPPPYVPPLPRQMRIERQGGSNEPMVRHYPKVSSGICEFCGVLDPKVPSQYQYKLCQHYRGMQLKCSYCPSNKNPDEVIYSSTLLVMDHPDRGGELIVVCTSYDCQKKHQERFQRSN